MPSLIIRSFILSTSLSTDGCRIDFEFTNGTRVSVPNLSPQRYAAAISTLQAVRTVYYHFDPSNNQSWLSADPDIPGSPS